MRTGIYKTKLQKTMFREVALPGSVYIASAITLTMRQNCFSVIIDGGMDTGPILESAPIHISDIGRMKNLEQEFILPVGHCLHRCLIASIGFGIQSLRECSKFKTPCSPSTGQESTMKR